VLKDLMADNFQYTVSEQLICNRSILDILSHHQESTAKIQRTIAKTISSCGCVQMEINREQPIGDVNNDLTGSLCSRCRERIENEIGRSLVYLAALCNLLDVNMFDVIIQEHNKMELLGRYI